MSGRMVRLIALGIGSHYAMFAFLYFVLFFFKKIFVLIDSGTRFLPSGYALEIFFMAIGGLVLTLTAAIFLGYLIKDKNTAYTNKLLWMVALLMFSPVSVPAFFWTKVIKSRDLSLFERK